MTLLRSDSKTNLEIKDCTGERFTTLWYPEWARTQPHADQMRLKPPWKVNYSTTFCHHDAATSNQAVAAEKRTWFSLARRRMGPVGWKTLWTWKVAHSVWAVLALTGNAWKFSKFNSKSWGAIIQDSKTVLRTALSYQGLLCLVCALFMIAHHQCQHKNKKSHFDASLACRKFSRATGERLGSNDLCHATMRPSSPSSWYGPGSVQICPANRRKVPGHLLPHKLHSCIVMNKRDFSAGSLDGACLFPSISARHVLKWIFLPRWQQVLNTILNK